MAGKWTPKKSAQLLKLFKEWLDNEFDPETLALTRQMIQNRETVVKKALDIYNRKQIKGFTNKEGYDNSKKI